MLNFLFGARSLDIIGRIHRCGHHANLNVRNAFCAMREADVAMIENTSVKKLKRKLTRAIQRVGERGCTVD